MRNIISMTSIAHIQKTQAGSLGYELGQASPRERGANRRKNFVPRARKRLGVRKLNQQIATYARRRRLNCISIREGGENAAEVVSCGFHSRRKFLLPV